MQLGAGKAMHTLDIRESRSSLAGVMMAAAMEGMGVYEFSQHVVPHLEDLSGAVGDVLSRVNLPALPGAGALSGGPKASAAVVTAPPGDGEAAIADAGGNGAAPRRRRHPRRRPRRPTPRRRRRRRPRRRRRSPARIRPPRPQGRRGQSPRATRSPAERGGAAPEAPELAGLGDGAPAGGATRTPVDEPPGSAAADRGRRAAGVPGRARARGAAGPARGRRRAGRRRSRAAGVVAAGGPLPARPGRDGRQAGCGGARAAARTRTSCSTTSASPTSRTGRIDPRIVGVLTKLSQEHKIVVSCMCSDHPKFTTGGSVSNHTFGRGLDIASIDGEIVSPGSALAREVASELSQFDPALRPDEIGSPFAINGPGYFTDAAHSEPHPRRLQDRDHARLQAPRRRLRHGGARGAGGRRTGGRRARGGGSGGARGRGDRPAGGPEGGVGPVRRAARAGQGRRRGRGAPRPAIRSCSCRRSPPRSSRRSRPLRRRCRSIRRRSI